MIIFTDIEEASDENLTLIHDKDSQYTTNKGKLLQLDKEYLPKPNN